MHLNTKSYLTKTILREICGEEITNKFLAEKIVDGSLTRHFSYYKPTIKFLKELNIIPEKVQIKDYSKLAKSFAFTQNEIMEIFECSRDVARLIIERYFIKRNNFYYRNPKLIELLEDGKEEIGI